MNDPSFVSNFKDRRKAIQALQVLVTAREGGLTNKEVLAMPFFMNLFSSEYLEGKTQLQLEWKLKNMLRDLGSMKFENLHPDFHDFKRHFESVRRKKPE